jgi:hypothetical protein
MGGKTEMSAATAMATDVLASLKSGVLLNGTVRSHSTDGSTNIAWIAIELPVVGERQVLVKDKKNLQPGQQVVIQCVPNPLKPERYMFRTVKVVKQKPTVAGSSPAPRLRNRCQWRGICMLRCHVAGEK